MTYKSTIKRALKVQEIVNKYYEQGRQDRSKLWVYRHYILKEFGISQRTFFYYLNITNKKSDNYKEPLQLSLF